MRLLPKARQRMGEAGKCSMFGPGEQSRSYAERIFMIKMYFSGDLWFLCEGRLIRDSNLTIMIIIIVFIKKSLNIMVIYNVSNNQHLHATHVYED